jgi:hypothetical protein
VIAWCKVHALGLDYVSVDELREVLAGLSPSDAASAPPATTA